ncbi:hypothetical protein DPMN_063667 [Dreissena polymorpha]|uniref:Uncharacterized protein n=1 Tax=Dreissena polymorpha TaxID=45954 RepID=A0A9D4CC53_DREPO|nr:hypothetical protein DPMN_063667 [Dreissena polymorpha]
MVVPANNRRVTITGFNRERRWSVHRALFDILSSDSNPHHDCLSLDALSAPNTPARRLPDNLQWYQDRLGTCRTIPDSLRRFQNVSQIIWETPRQCAMVSVSKSGGAPAGHSQIVYDGAKTVWEPA